VRRFNKVIKFRELMKLPFWLEHYSFLLFGYLIKTAEIINADTLVWAGIVAILFFYVLFSLKFLKYPYSSTFFVAPRGLITILLFLGIAPEQRYS
jgi:hypothetical protein